MWFITQCFGVGFRGSHRAGDSLPLPGPPDPPDMAPDPHDEGDFEGPDTRSLLGEFMAKMAQSVNDDYKNLHALLATLPDPSVDTGPVAMDDRRIGGWTTDELADTIKLISKYFLCMDGDEVSAATMQHLP